ncbi:3-deoxy-D-manno-octulosonic acid transferase [Roseateles sp. GG27B]
MKFKLTDRRPLPANRFKWRLFCLLLRLAALRNPAPRPTPEASLSPQPALWVFASTIGELNAASVYIDTLARHSPGLQLVLLTDHAHYREGFLLRFPAARVHVCSADADAAERLALGSPPRYLIVTEIPCLPGDAPCRFPVAYVFTASSQGARLAIVNAWFYDGHPSCRMDAIEHDWFASDYLAAFDAIGAQTEAVRQRLLDAGADPLRTAVTGNLKFDGLQARPSPAELSQHSPLIASLLLAQRPVLVAGCVTSFEEQAMVLDAFSLLLQRHPTALLVIAPRHPELADRMTKLREFLDVRQLLHCSRRALGDASVADAVSCLVLDTIGELRDFYAVATLAHVGVNHNALEPLSFDKPVTVIPGWLPSYASFPVYCLLMERQCLHQVSNSAEMAEAWASLLEDPAGYGEQVTRIKASLQDCGGATERNLALLLPGSTATATTTANLLNQAAH